MAKWILIESRDPLQTRDVERQFELAAGLAREGHQVTVFLIQNGVFPARRSATSALLEILSKSGVQVLADDFSLRERGIDGDHLAPGVQPAGVDVVIDRMADGAKALWH